MSPAQRKQLRVAANSAANAAFKIFNLAHMEGVTLDGMDAAFKNMEKAKDRLTEVYYGNIRGGNLERESE